jgi:hypothetical protein
MGSSFEILTRFLDRFGPEVEGRALDDPPDDVKRKLRALARGELTEAEREEMVQLLRDNPRWTSFLAEEVKSLRSKSEAGKKNP